MKIVLVGPTYPYRGGIAHYTTLLFHALCEEDEVLFCSFRKQYPRWLFPGRTDREPGGKLLAVDANYLLDPLNPLTWWQTAQHIRRWDPDMVILQWWVPFWAPAWLTLTTLLKRYTAAKLVFICHNVFPHESSPIDKWITKTVLRAGHGFVVHSASEKEHLASILPKATVEVNPLPSYRVFRQSTSSTKARATLNIEENEPVALFFGFVRPYKGLDVLLEALAHLKTLPVKLLVVGEFWLPESEVKAQIENLDLLERVTIVNRYITNEEVPLYFSAAEVVILPYRHTSQSAVAQMAFGFERPVITTSVGGLPEVVKHGITGYIVPPNDSLSLAKAIEKFFRLNEHQKEAFRHNIRKEAARFEWREMVSALKRAANACHISAHD